MDTYREIFEKAIVGIALNDPETGTVGEVNDRYAELMGWSRDELRDMTIEEISAVDPAFDQSAAMAKIERALTGEPQQFDWLFERQDGSTFWGEVALKQTSIGGDDRLLAFVRDVSERRRRERELQQYRTLVEAVGDPMYILDTDGRIEMVNAAMEAFLGTDAEQLVGSHVSEYMAAGDFEQGTDLIQTLLADPERHSGTYEITVVPLTGEPVPAEVNLSLVRDADGSYVGSAGVVRDISEHVEMTRRLETRKNEIQSLHGAAQDIVDSRDIDEVYEKTIRAAEQILEFERCAAMVYEDGQLVPKALTSGTPADGARPMDPDEGAAGHAFQTGEAIITDDIRADDRSKPAKEAYRSAISVPIGDLGVFQAVATEPRAFDERDVEIAKLLVAYTELTVERLRTERELILKNERLDEFAGVVSHDLRNPLNVAKGRLELARENPDDEQFEHLESALRRMDELLDDVLTLARQGEQVEDLEPVELAAVFERCWTTVETADARKVVDTDQTLMADESRLRQLLENLVRNAIEHAGDDVNVTIGDLETGFYVEDDGPGVPPDQRDDVFRAGHSTSERGTGFGLAIVKQIAQAHDWNVRVAESSSGGARFEITGTQPGR